MTNHSKGEADEGSVGVDGEVGEDRAEGEHEATKQEATSAEEDWFSIIIGTPEQRCIQRFLSDPLHPTFAF